MARTLNMIPLLALLVVAAAHNCHGAWVPGATFDRIIIVPLENTYVADVLADPYLTALSQGPCARLYGNYFATTHPSLPNYMTMIAGDYFGVQDDENHVVSNLCSVTDCDFFNTHTVHDLLDDRGITWKVYAEKYPGSLPVASLKNKRVDPVGCPNANYTGHDCYSAGGCFFGKFLGPDPPTGAPWTVDPRLYARKHVPQLTFDSFVFNESRCALVTDGNTFDKDLAAGKLPQYVFYVPDQVHDGHGTHLQDANVTVVSTFVKGFLAKLQAYKSITNTRTTVVFVYDENDYSSHKNQVFALAVGLGKGKKCTVSSPSTFMCPKKGCIGAPSQQQAYALDCADGTNYDGTPVKALDPAACAAAGGIAGWSSALKVVDKLKADTSYYTHFSILTAVQKNWKLATLGQAGEASKPLSFH